MTPAVIRRAASSDPQRLHDGYRESIGYRLGRLPHFVEKLPENFLYLGLIARAFPRARLVHVRRDPMDNAFALFKQSYFRFAYRLDDLGRYLEAHARLARHWHEILGDRLVTVDYERLVADQDGETRGLLAALGLGFEDACLRFENHPAPTNTASAVQVREKLHARSIGRWRHFARHLEPLAAALADG